MSAMEYVLKGIRKKLMRQISLLTCFIVALTSCKTNSRLFSEKTARDVYENRLKEAGILETTMGRTWILSGEKALTVPVSVTIPYRQAGYFAADKPRAIGLKFDARRGERLTFSLSKKSSTAFILFLDLWKSEPGKAPRKEYFLDTSKTSFHIDVDDNATYILRMQPELLHAGEYELSISSGPSLAYPVPKGKIGSLWGAARDGGARKHEGIDIFAPKRTPVVAVAAGRVTRVEETPIGGKVVWLRPEDKNLSIYYAHLDEQLVQPGDNVRSGDTIGLVGNTGNAMSTSPHLHFGIYGFGGATDPFLFVSPEIRKVTSELPLKEFNQYMRIKTNSIATGNNVILVTDGSVSSVFGESPSGEAVVVPASQVLSTKTPITITTLKKQVRMLDSPQLATGAIGMADAGEKLKTLGYHGEFALVENGDVRGWVLKADLR